MPGLLSVAGYLHTDSVKRILSDPWADPEEKMFKADFLEDRLYQEWWALLYGSTRAWKLACCPRY